MITRKLTVPKTARYFLSNEPSSVTREVVFVCHGYAQLANEFLREFDPIVHSERTIVAPEGLHRFYQRGGYEKVGASWMTKEDRLDDVHDYVQWLDLAAADVLLRCPRNVKITVIGFSQGAATVSRWAAMGMTAIDHLILWCGFFPPDLHAQHPPKCKALTIVTGSNDKYYDAVSEARHLTDAKAIITTYKHIRFTGGHEVHAGTLSEIFNAVPR